MKKIAILILSVLFSVACTSTAQTANTNITVSNAAAQNPNDSLVVSSHSGSANTAENTAENTTIVPRSETKTMWKQSGTPIDVKKNDAEIAEAEKTLKSKPGDEAAKKNLSEAYMRRGIALTEARQYASALGDYRRSVKYDSTNEESKSGMEVILTIYKSLNREAPSEGQEPPPLPFIKPEDVKPKTSTENIKFQPGATSEIVTGNLTGYTDSKSFLIAVKSGQTLNTEQLKEANDSTAYVTVVVADSSGKYLGDSDASCNNRKAIKVTAAAEYRITVTECTKAEPWNGQFKLKVSAE